MGNQTPIRLQSLILWTLIPALALITMVSGWRLYSRLYDVILDGFDRKLFALSTTASVFMDGDALLAVAEPYHARPLAYHAGRETLYSVDVLTWNLVTLDVEAGGATPVGPLGVDGLTDLTYAASLDQLFALAGEAVYRVDAETGAAEKAFELDDSFALLAWDTENSHLLLGATSRAVRLDPETGDITPWLSDVDLSGLTAWTVAAGEPARIFTLAGESGAVYSVDIQTGARALVGEVLPEGTRFGEVEYGEEAGELPAFGLEWNPEGGQLWATSDRLMVVDAETALAEGGLWMATWFRGAEGKVYDPIVEPMRRILELKNITYMYTFKPGGRKDIVYLVDASSGDDWCPIGYEEELPEQNIEGIHLAITEGVPFISDVLEFDLWGLLKVASAPVYARDGETIRALAGVDINISIIRSKTRVALFQVFGIGLAALLLAGAVSLWVTRRLTVPINILKFGALRIAAGSHQHRIEVRQPRELGLLADALNTIGGALSKTVRDMRDTGERMEQGRRRTELARALASSAGTEVDAPGQAFRWLGNRILCADASGVLRAQDVTIAWLAHAETDVLQAVRKRSDIASALSLLLRHTGTELVEQELSSLFLDEVKAWMIQREGTEQVDVLARMPFEAASINSAGRVTRQTVKDRARINLVGGNWAVLSSDPDGKWIPENELGHADSVAHTADLLETHLGSHRVTDDKLKIIGLLVVFGLVNKEDQK